MMLPNALRNSAVSAMTLDKPDKSHKLQQPNSAHTPMIKAQDENDSNTVDENNTQAASKLAHRIQMRTPRPATTVLGARETTYQAVDRSSLRTLRVGLASPISPNT